jgi:deoxyribodipyrimidine photo-lyase
MSSPPANLFSLFKPSLTKQELRSLTIRFTLLRGFAPDVMPAFVDEVKAGCVVTDFSPLRIGLSWVQGLATKLDALSVPIPLLQVDAHNVVPCWVASEKLEYGARTIRPKITKQLNEWLVEFPKVVPHEFGPGNGEPVDWETVIKTIEVDRSVPEIEWLKPGTKVRG